MFSSVSRNFFLSPSFSSISAARQSADGAFEESG